MKTSHTDINQLARRLNMRISLIVAVAFVVIIAYTSYRNYVTLYPRGGGGDMETFLINELPIVMFAFVVMIVLQASLRKSVKKVTTPVVRNVNKTEAAAQRLESELNIAHGIQKSLLPRPLAVGEIDGVNVTGFLRTARQVGGDLYDYFVSGRTLYFAIGDVSGKGVPGALTMATTRRLLRTLMNIQRDLTEVMCTLNDALCEGNDSNQFVTLIIGSLNIDSGRLTLCNAGHTPPYIVNARGNVRPVEMTRNLPVGLFPKYRFKADHLRLRHSLLLYTDGVTDIENEQGEVFGTERLVECIGQGHGKPIATLVGDVVAQATAFGNGKQGDDISLLGIELVRTENMHEQHIVMKNNLGEVAHITALVEELGEMVRLDAAEVSRLTLALEEAAVNVISYAYPKGQSDTFELNVKVTNICIVFELVDHGTPFDPTVVPDPDIKAEALDRPIGGLGIMLVKKCMTNVIYEREDNENHLTMIYNYSEQNEYDNKNQ